MSKSLSCWMLRHHYETIADDNPENRGYHYRRCTSCGKIKEGKVDSFPRVDKPVAGGGGFIAF